MNIYEKLVELRKEVEYLQKTLQGNQGVSSSAVLAKIRPKMDELKIVLIPAITNAKTFPKNSYGKKDSKELFTEVFMEYTWVNAEDPTEMVKIPWYTQGIDMGEKGIGKALTYGEKYVILKTLQIPTDKDDPDQFAQNTVEYITKVEGQAIKDRCENAGMDEQERKRFLAGNQISKDTTKAEAKEFIKNIETKIKEWKEVK
jgi:hypothetical protein